MLKLSAQVTNGGGGGGGGMPQFCILYYANYYTILATIHGPMPPPKYAPGYGIWKMPERNGMEDFKNAMKDNLPYFHTNSILDFPQGIYRKIYTESDNEQYVEVFRS